MALAVEAKEQYLAEFETFEKGLGKEPGWLRSLRREAIARFQETGFPTAKHEDWKYTNLAPLQKISFKPAILGRPERVPQETLEAFSFGVLKTTLLVFVNGRFSPRLSYVRAVPEGVRIARLAEVLREEPEAVEPHLGRLAPRDGNPFTALNTAFLQDGAFVHVPGNTVVEEPIHLLFLSTAKDLPLVSYPRNLILLGTNSQVTLIETYAGWSPEVYLTNAVTEVAVGRGAHVDHYKMERESGAAFHVATAAIEQGRESDASFQTFSFGAGLARNYVLTTFREEGASLVLNGLFMTGGTSQSDHYTRIDHVAPACTSLELYKGILNERSRGVFNGNIFVRAGAQKTSARQVNKNLLLSSEAFVDSTPGLEILADDVKCNHASTIGQLDEDAVFYLRTRGIDEDAARNILTYAFAADIVNRIRVAPIRIKVDQLILSRLPRASGAPRGPSAPGRPARLRAMPSGGRAEHA